MSVARHTLYNFGGAVIPLAVSIVTVPIYLRVIGLERYGLLAICWLLVGYFNLFDFGIGRATAQKIATMAKGPAEDRNRIFWTGAAITLLLSLIAVLLFFPLARIGLPLMTGKSAVLGPEVNAALPILIAAIPFGIAQSLLNGTLEGRREFFKNNAILSFGSILTASLPLLAAHWLGPRLPVLITASLVSRGLVLALLSAACARALPIQRPRFATRVELRGLLHFGGWATVTNIVGPVLVFLDRFMIGVLIGAAAVALYVVPFNLVSQLSVIPAALGRALFPRLAEAGDEEGRLLGDEALRFLALALTPMTIVMAAAIGPFLNVWLGPTANGSIPVGEILLFGFWANSLAQIPYIRLQALGRPDLTAWAHVAEIIPYLALLYIAMSAYGVIGAAMAWSARCSIDALVMALMGRVDRKLLMWVTPQAVIVLLAVMLCLTLPFDSGLRWVTLGIMAAVTGLIFLLNLPPQLKAIVHARFRLARREQT